MGSANTEDWLYKKKSKLQGNDWAGGGGGCEQRLARNDHGAPSSNGNVLYLDRGGGYTGKHICKAHWNIHEKWVHAIVCKLYL